ncbi:MAG TPA: hypothetical protein VGX94_18505 [Terriglobia bacterium]|nr:hypothetical protein [Terriglobia bacterium]
MIRKLSLLSVVICLVVCATGRADFKYVQTTQITGGAMASMMKGLGVFSKSARQATKPMASTTYVKNNHLRTDNADGTYQIIDLDGRRFIQIDPNHQTYSVITFEQMRQAMEQMEQQLKQKQAEAKNSQNGDQNAQVTVTPKIEISATGKTQSILGQETQEMLVKMDLEMQSTDAQHGTQSGTLSTEMDEWLAPSIIGYHEVSDFYKKMATEIGWTPHTAFGMDPRMVKSMVELNKSGKIPVGLPMLSTVSMLGAPQGDQTASQQQQPQQQDQQQSSSGLSSAMNPSGAAVKALGGMFARRRKKQQEQENQNASAPPATVPKNSLMSITSEVTSFSTDSLDDSLFQIPAGFNQVQSNPNQTLQGRTH